MSGTIFCLVRCIAVTGEASVRLVSTEDSDDGTLLDASSPLDLHYPARYEKTTGHFSEATEDRPRLFIVDSNPRDPAILPMLLSFPPREEEAGVFS